MPGPSLGAAFVSGPFITGGVYLKKLMLYFSYFLFIASNENVKCNCDSTLVFTYYPIKFFNDQFGNFVNKVIIKQVIISSTNVINNYLGSFNWCKNTCCVRGIAQTDSKIAACLVTSNSMYLGSECFVVEDLRSLLRSYPHLSVSFAFREGNSVAHAVAKFAVSFDNIAMWFYKGPIWLMSLVLNDVPTV